MDAWVCSGIRREALNPIPHDLLLTEGFAEGSYSWSGEAVKLFSEMLEEMKIKVLDEGIRVKSTPMRVSKRAPMGSMETAATGAISSRNAELLPSTMT
jgi:hypothetical protein